MASMNGEGTLAWLSRLTHNCPASGKVDEEPVVSRFDRTVGDSPLWIDGGAGKLGLVSGRARTYTRVQPASNSELCMTDSEWHTAGQRGMPTSRTL
jgi:hypothetical protein